jgi:hypothetical protein
MPRFVPLGDSMLEIIRAGRQLGHVGDVQGLGSMDAAQPTLAGASGRLSDAGHQHPARITDGTNPSLQFDQTFGTITTWKVIVGADGHLYLQNSGGFGNAARITNTGRFEMYPTGGVLTPTGAEFNAGGYIRLSDLSGTPNKYLQTSGGALRVANSGFLSYIFTLDDLGNQTLAGSFTVGAGKSVVFPLAAQIQMQDAGAASNWFFQVDAAKELTIQSAQGQPLRIIAGNQLNVEGGLKIGNAVGDAITAVFVRATTPTEIDGALWFQG